MEINTPEHRLRMAPWWGMALYLAVGAVWVALGDALLAALITVGVLLTGITFFVGYIAGYIFNVFLQNGTAGSFIATFSSFSDVGDMWLALVKAVVFGLIVAVVGCQKGLDTSGGPAGVANSVNAAVVESILLLMFVNVLMSQLYVIIFPRQAL